MAEEGAPQTKVAVASPATVMLRFPASIAIIVGRNRAFGEQAGKIVGVYGVAQEKRAGHMEDFLQGAQIRRVGEKLANGRPFTLG